MNFGGTAQSVSGNINCPVSVTAAAVYYVFYTLMPRDTPASYGSLKPIAIAAPKGCLVNAIAPSACAAGNVETSQRLVDVLLLALSEAIPDRIPASSQGTICPNQKDVYHNPHHPIPKTSSSSWAWVSLTSLVQICFITKLIIYCIFSAFLGVFNI